MSSNAETLVAMLRDNPDAVLTVAVWPSGLSVDYPGIDYLVKWPALLAAWEGVAPPDNPPDPTPPPTSPPDNPPSPPTTFTLYVVSTNGVKVRDGAGTDQLQTKVNGQLVALPYKASVEVTATLYNDAANAYKWRQIASGPNQGRYVAQSQTATATVYLSATAPK